MQYHSWRLDRRFCLSAWPLRGCVLREPATSECRVYLVFENVGMGLHARSPQPAARKLPICSSDWLAGWQSTFYFSILLFLSCQVLLF